MGAQAILNQVTSSRHNLLTLCDKNVVKGDGYKHGGTVGKSGLLYDKVTEKKILGECMDKWQQSSRCDPSSSGDRCGIVLLNYKHTGHCRNVLFEKCAQNGGDGHENLIKRW